MTVYVYEEEITCKKTIYVSLKNLIGNEKPNNSQDTLRKFPSNLMNVNYRERDL